MVGPASPGPGASMAPFALAGEAARHGGIGLS